MCVWGSYWSGQGWERCVCHHARGLLFSCRWILATGCVQPACGEGGGAVVRGAAHLADGDACACSRNPEPGEKDTQPGGAYEPESKGGSSSQSSSPGVKSVVVSLLWTRGSCMAPRLVVKHPGRQCGGGFQTPAASTQPASLARCMACGSAPRQRANGVARGSASHPASRTACGHSQHATCSVSLCRSRAACCCSSLHTGARADRAKPSAIQGSLGMVMAVTAECPASVVSRARRCATCTGHRQAQAGR